jgi:hypothetical protein
MSGSNIFLYGPKTCEEASGLKSINTMAIGRIFLKGIIFCMMLFIIVSRALYAWGDWIDNR